MKILVSFTMYTYAYINTCTCVHMCLVYSSAFLYTLVHSCILLYMYVFYSILHVFLHVFS